jgi:hypothetical protein
VKYSAAAAVLAGIIEPEDAKGERAFDDGGRFIGVDSDDGPGG